MGWQGRLQLDYRLDGRRTVGRDSHHGPLRVLKSLHPEGPGTCHHVLVHPPGGLAGGDRLELAVTLGEGAHALVTTPGATRFYRSLASRRFRSSTPWSNPARVSSGCRSRRSPTAARMPRTGCASRSQATRR